MTLALSCQQRNWESLVVCLSTLVLVELLHIAQMQSSAQSIPPGKSVVWVRLAYQRICIFIEIHNYTLAI